MKQTRFALLQSHKPTQLLAPGLTKGQTLVSLGHINASIATTGISRPHLENDFNPTKLSYEIQNQTYAFNRILCPSQNWMAKLLAKNRPTYQ